MNNLIVTFFFLLFSLQTFAQNKFPKFNYVTTAGDTINNKILNGKTTLIIVGHISCPGVLLLLRDMQRSALDTIQTILLLENTKDQLISFNTADTNDIWGMQRHAFRLNPINFYTVTFCDKQKLKTKANGTIVIKNQCNKLKTKYRAFEAPKIYALNEQGQIIRKQTGWYMNLTDPKDYILRLFTTL